MATHVGQVLPLSVEQVAGSVYVVVAYFRWDVQLPSKISSSPDDLDSTSLRFTTKVYLYSSMIGEREDLTWLTLIDFSMYN
jgi:hypothetical protein